MNKWQILGVLKPVILLFHALKFGWNMGWHLLGKSPTTMESILSTATIAQLVACFFWSLPDSSMGSWLAGKIARSGMASPLEMEHLSSDGDDREGRILACGIWQFFLLRLSAQAQQIHAMSLHSPCSPPFTTPTSGDHPHFLCAAVGCLRHSSKGSWSSSRLGYNVAKVAMLGRSGWMSCYGSAQQRMDRWRGEEN